MKAWRARLSRVPGLRHAYGATLWLAERAVFRQLETDSRDIERELQHRALRDTVDYIQAHLPHARIHPHRRMLLDAALAAVGNTNGLYCEFGVWKGATINHIASRVNARVYGFDSFEGLPQDWRAGYEKGHFQVGRLPKVRSNVELFKGWFEHTLPPFLERHRDPIAFAHVDCDLYASTKTIFEFAGRRIVDGTILVFDEYFNYPGWQLGEHQAFQEFCALHSIRYEYLGYCRNDAQVAVRITGVGG